MWVCIKFNTVVIQKIILKGYHIFKINICLIINYVY